MGSAESQSNFNAASYVRYSKRKFDLDREGISEKDVLGIKEAFDALEENHTGVIMLSKLRKNGFNEEFVNEFNGKVGM
jgi:hypothetical protein